MSDPVFFSRSENSFLWEWFAAPKRRPLFLKGMHQVGKTSWIRHLASLCEKPLAVIDFAQNLDWRERFESADLESICAEIQGIFPPGVMMESGILLLNNIQYCPEALSVQARLFSRKPDCAIISSGFLPPKVKKDRAFLTLLRYFQGYELGPLSFSDFLAATGQLVLAEWIQQWQWGDGVPIGTHLALVEQLKRFTLVGGHPLMVAKYIAEGLSPNLMVGHQELLSSALDNAMHDQRRTQLYLAKQVLAQVQQDIGQKCQYRRISRDHAVKTVQNAIGQLVASGLLTRVIHSSSDNTKMLPVLKNEKYFKLFMSDVGMLSAQMGISYRDLERDNVWLSETHPQLGLQFVAQHVFQRQCSGANSGAGYYWQRESRNASSTVDFLLPVGESVVPVMLKSGKSGTLRGMHQWLEDKGGAIGVRINDDRPSLVEDVKKLSTGKTLRYQLATVPWYLVEALPRLLSTQPSMAGQANGVVESVV